MPRVCRCSPRWSVTTNANGAWSSTPAGLSWRAHAANTYPATHYASTTPATQTNVPAMGQRVRLKSTFVIPPTWTKQEKALLLGLKKYGALVADNGGFFSISITPDDRWPANAFNHISSIGITNFEVIQTTGPTGGPRSPGAPA